MKVAKRADTNSWYFTFKDARGKHRRKSGFKTKTEATAAMRAFIREGERLKNNVTFGEYYATYFKAHVKPHISVSARAGWKQVYDQASAFFGAQAPLDSITRTQYQQFLNSLSDKLALSSIQLLNSRLKKIFQSAVYEGLIQQTPVHEVKMSSTVKTRKSSEKFLSANECIKLIDALKSADTITALCLYVMAVTGARWAEATAITTEHIDAENMRVWLPGTKTEAAPRWVEVSQSDIDYILHQVEKLKINPGAFICKVANSGANELLKKILRKLEIRNIITPHGLRHTHASLLLKNGVDIQYVSARLGHSNMAVTMKVYAHLLEEKRVLEADKTRDILEGLQ